MQGNKFLIACILVYTLLTAALIFSVPIGAAPDEGAHLEYAQHLAENKSLPIFEPKGANSPGYEFHQPPLYYSVAALAYGVLPHNTAAYAARIISLFCGALTLVFLWHSIRLLFPDDRVLAPLATGFGALWPLHLGVGASAGNDAIAGAMCAGVFWAMARLARRIETPEYSWRDAAIAGVFCGLGILSKSTSLVIAIAGILSAWHLARNNKSTRAFTPPIIVAGVMLLICGWWLARNTMLYGDPLAARIFDEAFKNSSPRPQALIAATGISLFGYVRAFFLILFATCWGLFGGPNTAITMLNPFGARGPRFEAYAALPLMPFFLIATVVALWGFWKWKMRESKTPEISESARIALLWWGIGFGLVVLALARFNLIQFQAQARYLHPALLPMCLIFALGWKTIFGEDRALRIFSVCFGAVLLLITLWNVFVWKTLV